MSYQNLLTERIDKVALITLNRPEKLNALSYELACEIDEELKNIENDDGVSVVILTGAGPRAFSAGGDIHQMVKSTPEELAARSEVRSRATWHLATFSKPIIGAINGLAYGAGALLTSMLDMRIGCEHAEFQFLAAKYGRANSTWSLPLVVGMPKAKELLYTGRLVKAEEAEQIGLLNQLVPCAELRDTSIANGATYQHQRLRAWCKASNGWCMKTSAWIGVDATTTSKARARPISKPTRRARDSKTFWLGKESAEAAFYFTSCTIRR